MVAEEEEEEVVEEERTCSRMSCFARSISAFGTNDAFDCNFEESEQENKRVSKRQALLYLFKLSMKVHSICGRF